MNVDEMRWFEDQVTQFKSVRPRYQQCATALESILEHATRALGVAALVQARPKTVPSFAEKVLRKRDKYRDPLRQLTDLCGARVIAQTKHDVEMVCHFIREYFLVDEANSLDVLERLRAAEFGYRSVHYVVQLKAGTFPNHDIPVEVPPAAYPDADQPMKAEIQVRTIAQHAWADIGHDRLYKSGFDVPSTWIRESARIAALLESTDEAFERLVAAIDAYSVGRGVAIKKERLHEQSDKQRKRIREEIEILEAVRRCHEDDERHALRIAQLATCLEDWQRVVELLDSGSGRIRRC
jgi:ppGpp synthetase/RelA/SpoT-type nucleotidyltranferase